MMRTLFHFAYLVIIAAFLISCSDDTSSPTTPESSSEAPESSSSEEPESSSSEEPESSSSEEPESSSSEPVVESPIFGYKLKNAPTPSKGCGTQSTLEPNSTLDNGTTKLYKMTIAEMRREFYMDLPENYDNNKPYKVIFAFQFMGTPAVNIATGSGTMATYSPYYGQKELDTENNYIFVAPRGEDGFVGYVWRVDDDKDHIFFDEMLTLLEDNFCIDTSRVFVTGFSFGAMFSNSLAQDFQHRIRAAVTYGVADINIYIPENAGKPIAWMDVHGINDDNCSYKRLDSSITRILRHNGPADSEGNFTDVSDEIEDMERYTEDMGETHVCYSFQKVDPRFPVQVCTWNGGHQWTASDDGNWENTWVPQKVREFIEQF